MTQTDNIIALASAVGVDVKTINTTLGVIQNQIGTLTNLDTTTKASLVAAINEIYGMIGEAGAVIDDLTPSASTVYSSNKSESLVTGMVKFNAVQTLTQSEQIQASVNIGVGDITTDFVAEYNTAKA